MRSAKPDEAFCAYGLVSFQKKSRTKSLRKLLPNKKFMKKIPENFPAKKKSGRIILKKIIPKNSGKNSQNFYQNFPAPTPSGRPCHDPEKAPFYPHISL